MCTHIHHRGGDQDDWTLGQLGIPSVTAEVGYAGQFIDEWQVKDASTAFLQSGPYPDGKVKYIWFRDPVSKLIKYYQQSGPIYGEAATPVLWERTIAPWLEDQGFRRGENERSIFWHPDKDLLLLLYVDDCLVDGEHHRVRARRAA